jgi:hypothetical protein
MKPLQLDHIKIAEQWATIKGQPCDLPLSLKYEDQICEAAICGFLTGVRESYYPDTDVDKLWHPKPLHLHYIIQRDDLLTWLERTQQWPLPAGCLLAEWFEENEPQAKTENGEITTTTKRTTKLNSWLREKWDEMDKPNARDFVLELKSYAGTYNCPVKKYYGWYPKIAIEWVDGWGSPGMSWGNRAFANKVSAFRQADKEAAEKLLSRE